MSDNPPHDRFVQAMRVLARLPGYQNAKDAAVEAFAAEKSRAEAAERKVRIYGIANEQYQGERDDYKIAFESSIRERNELSKSLAEMTKERDEWAARARALDGDVETTIRERDKARAKNEWHHNPMLRKGKYCALCAAAIEAGD